MRIIVDVLATIFLLIIFMLAIASYVKAHDWYDADCCSNYDCAPAKIRFYQDNKAFPPVNYAEVETKHGKETVNLNTFPKNGIRTSLDENYHACLVPLGDGSDFSTEHTPPSNNKKYYVRCIYFPVRM